VFYEARICIEEYPDDIGLVVVGTPQHGARE
jgi:hypothetical protein